ncbi:sugar phosphate isomerase/epimerase family protein [Aestuariicoccus sp. MJ-SS9]|uniref:sugar phosphate isomerase/epimerase family protein n=1 Tax=Aestuariicoccus sp. MJ-SS9 TaxID=3079855 RepID=UPI00290EAF17|nr:sugar phosphate isomerase/epimerase family protein [Aestuariicoccus sp. MJ-SS9]MDU8910320.1 sugar phosphate isomerase/epimerase family protein [Aestuariicoccus sp. MJ-SS9]
MRLGVICDGISRDLAHTLDVMDEFAIDMAELQFVWDAEVGDHSAQDIRRIDSLLRDRGKRVACLSRHVFAGLTTANSPGDAEHTRHMEALRRVIGMAQVVGSPLVRIMTNRKEQILWGRHGAEQWNVAKGAWDKTLALIAPAVDLARAEGTRLVVETGNGTMVNSAWTGRRLIDDLGAKDVLGVLWDPANNCWCHEDPMAGYAVLRDGYLGHVHIKDVQVDTPRATLEVRPMGQGQLGPAFADMARALREDGYDGVVSFESVYHPGDGDFEAGFRMQYDSFRDAFGPGQASG